jgi:hypothetical protein
LQQLGTRQVDSDLKKKHGGQTDPLSFADFEFIKKTTMRQTEYLKYSVSTEYINFINNNCISQIIIPETSKLSHDTGITIAL